MTVLQSIYFVFFFFISKSFFLSQPKIGTVDKGHIFLVAKVEVGEKKQGNCVAILSLDKVCGAYFVFNCYKI